MVTLYGLAINFSKLNQWLIWSLCERGVERKMGGMAHQPNCADDLATRG